MTSGRLRLALAIGGVCALVTVSALAVRAATTAPPRGQGELPLETFAPERVGTLEQEAWAAYYYREWPRLGQLLLELIQGQFGLSAAQSVEAAVLATRAQVVFAERGAAGGEAEEYMRQFYALVRDPSGGQYDPERAAALELNWWVVHRNRAQYPDTTALVDALAALSAEVYRLPVDAARPAAEHRALAMEASDLWIADGKDRASPLLATVRNELVLSYQALHEALEARRAARTSTPG
jgi:hypothetical protein